MTEHSGETVCSFKRFMGTDKKYILGGSTYTPMELSAMVLERIRRNAEFALGEEIEEAIITVPAYFNDKQRSDTKKAAKIAGLRVERLVNEPSAAALAYRMEYGEEDRTLLVFDFGGGTLDLSYVECFDNIIEIVAVAGDNYLGGDDIDRLAAEYFCRENGLQWDRLSPEEQASLKRASEAAKIRLEYCFGEEDMRRSMYSPGITTVDVFVRFTRAGWMTEFARWANGILVCPQSLCRPLIVMEQGRGNIFSLSLYEREVSHGGDTSCQEGELIGDSLPLIWKRWEMNVSAFSLMEELRDTVIWYMEHGRYGGRLKSCLNVDAVCHLRRDAADGAPVEWEIYSNENEIVEN